MKILQAGAAKSGNFWLYRILQSIIYHANLPRYSFIQNHPIQAHAKTWELSYAEQAKIDVLDIDSQGYSYRISSIFKQPIADLDDYLSQCTHVWTHSSICSQSAIALPKFDKVIYIIRDPRDVALSMARFAFTPYMKKNYPHRFANSKEFLNHNLASTLRHWVEHVSGYLECRDRFEIHVVFYEQLLLNFEVEFERLVNYLDVSLSSQSLALIKHEVGFEAMRQSDPQHVRKGRSGAWVTELSDRQKRTAAAIAAPLLEMLNYPILDAADAKLPSLSPLIESDELHRAIVHAQRRPAHIMILLRLKRFLQFHYANRFKRGI